MMMFNMEYNPETEIIKISIIDTDKKVHEFKGLAKEKNILKMCERLGKEFALLLDSGLLYLTK